MRKKKVISCLLAGAMLLGAQQVWAATVHYNDSSITGGSEAWNAYKDSWNTLANDYTYVSLTPGAAATEATSISPEVIVPVLSRHSVSTRASVSTQ